MTNKNRLLYKLLQHLTDHADKTSLKNIYAHLFDDSVWDMSLTRDLIYNNAALDNIFINIAQTNGVPLQTSSYHNQRFKNNKPLVSTELDGFYYPVIIERPAYYISNIDKDQIVFSSAELNALADQLSKLLNFGIINNLSNFKYITSFIVYLKRRDKIDSFELPRMYQILYDKPEIENIFYNYFYFFWSLVIYGTELAYEFETFEIKFIYKSINIHDLIINVLGLKDFKPTEPIPLNTPSITFELNTNKNIHFSSMVIEYLNQHLNIQPIKQTNVKPAKTHIDTNFISMLQDLLNSNSKQE